MKFNKQRLESAKSWMWVWPVGCKVVGKEALCKLYIYISMFPNGQNSCLKKHLHLQTSIMSKHILQISLNFALSSCQQQKNTTECFLSNWSTLDQSGSLQKTLRILLEKNKLKNLIEKTWKNRKQMQQHASKLIPTSSKIKPFQDALGPRSPTTSTGVLPPFPFGKCERPPPEKPQATAGMKSPCKLTHPLNF